MAPEVETGLTRASRRGLFISFEGIEGTGKSTQVRLLAGHLKKKGHEVVMTAEPGGTPIGLKIREVLLNVGHKEMSYLTELLLYNASRSQHVEEVIMPSIEAGKIVLTDRFSDSTRAYQGYARGIDLSIIDSLDRISTGGLKPDITVLLDLDVEAGLRRNRDISKIDRLELEDIEFHKKVRAGYLRLSEKEPERFRLVDASVSIEDVHKDITAVITSYMLK